MPKKPSVYCPRCRTSHDGPCPAKPAWGWNRKRDKRSGRGGHKWSVLREHIFQRDNYLCQIHKAVGKIKTVELHGPRHGVLDHKIALSHWNKAHGDPDQELNLWTICQECDQAKTAAERNTSPIIMVAGHPFDLLDLKMSTIACLKSSSSEVMF